MPDQAAEERWFTAEHIFRWMWEDYSGLHPHREAAHAPRRAPLAEAVRRRPARPQRGPGRRRRSTSTTCTSSARSPRRRRRRSAASTVDHERVRAQRPARRRRAGPRPADRPGPRPGLNARARRRPRDRPGVEPVRRPAAAGSTAFRTPAGATMRPSEDHHDPEEDVSGGSDEQPLPRRRAVARPTPKKSTGVAELRIAAGTRVPADLPGRPGVDARRRTRPRAVLSCPGCAGRCTRHDAVVDQRSGPRRAGSSRHRRRHDHRVVAGLLSRHDVAAAPMPRA